jgi:ABC-2 type transport system permease protein
MSGTSEIGAVAAQSMAAVRGAFADRPGFRQVGGWGLSDFARLIGVVYLLFGVPSIFLGGYRDLAGAILRGDIEPLLTQPGLVLPRLLARESIPSAWGDILAALVVLTFSARLDGAGVALTAAAVAIVAVVWLSTAVIFASLAFWVPGSRSLARDLMDFTLMISMYPSSIYTGWTKILIFTLLPAGFIAIAPVAMARHPSLEAFGASAGAAVVFPALAALVFGAGLRRYRRGLAPAT